MTPVGLAAVGEGLHRLGRLGASRRVHTRLAEAAGVSLGQQEWQVLRTVAAAPGPSPVADVARHAHMDVGAVSRQLKSLEDAGLVTRVHSPAHARVVLVDATERGRREVEAVAAVLDRHLAEALADWDDADRRRLGELLLRLVDDLTATPYRRDGEG